MATKKKKNSPQILLQGPKIFLCGSGEEFKQILEEIKVEHYQHEWLIAGSCGTTHSLDNKKEPIAIVSLNFEMKMDLITAYETLIHEGVHVWQDYCAYIGEDRPSREFEAYGIQRIVANLLVKYDERIKGK